MSGLLFQRLREHGVACETMHHPDPRRRLVSSACFTVQNGLIDPATADADLVGASESSSTRLIWPSPSQIHRLIAHAGRPLPTGRTQRAAVRSRPPQDFDHRCLDRLDSVDANTIRQVADRWLRRPSLSLCGPRQSLEALKQLWGRQSSLS